MEEEYSRDNWWKVQWVEDGKLVFKRFDQELPTQAVEFGKNLKRRGISVVDIISGRKAYPPSIKQLHSPQIGYLWCPYCVKWREFHEAGLSTMPTLVYMRCTTCRISIHDAYVRSYNPELILKYEIEAEMKQKRREATRAKRNSGSNPFRRRRR